MFEGASVNKRCEPRCQPPRTYLFISCTDSWTTSTVFYTNNQLDHWYLCPHTVNSCPTPASCHKRSNSESSLSLVLSFCKHQTGCEYMTFNASGPGFQCVFYKQWFVRMSYQCITPQTTPKTSIYVATTSALAPDVTTEFKNYSDSDPRNYSLFGQTSKLTNDAQNDRKENAISVVTIGSSFYFIIIIMRLIIIVRCLDAASCWSGAVCAVYMF